MSIKSIIEKGIGEDMFKQCLKCDELIDCHAHGYHHCGAFIGYAEKNTERVNQHNTTLEEIRSQIPQMEKEILEEIEGKLKSMQLVGLSFTEVQKDAYNTAINDVTNFINQLKEQK